MLANHRAQKLGTTRTWTKLRKSFLAGIESWCYCPSQGDGRKYPCPSPVQSGHLPPNSKKKSRRFPHPPYPCLQSSRFRRRSVSRDVRGQAGAGASIGPVTCGKSGRGESLGRRPGNRASSYQASPWPPGQVRYSRASGKVSRKEIANEATQRGEVITCRDRKSRENAEGHAYAEPHLTIIRGFAYAWTLRIAL